MQRVLGSGKLHRRRECYPLCLELPGAADAPFSVLAVWADGAPCYEELPCHERGAALLSVSIPLAVQLRDAAGRCFTLSAAIQEELRLRCACPEQECWRGQIYLQAAARLAGSCCLDGTGCGSLPLELILEGYILTSCMMGAPVAPPCPEAKPWYPQPGFDPYR